MKGTAVGEGRTSLKHGLALLATSVLTVLLLGEVAARIVLPAPLPWLYPQVRYQADRLLIFTLKPDQEAFTADRRVHVNGRGLRGAVMPYEKSRGRQRILFLGDSIVFGFGVSESETVSARTRDHLAKRGFAADVLNAGVPSYNIAQEAKYLEQEGIRYHPDWVIVGACWNDINEKTEAWVNSDGWLMNWDAPPPSRLSEWSVSPVSYSVRNAVKRSRLAYGTMEGLQVLSSLGKGKGQSQFRTDVLEGRSTRRVSEGWQEVRAALGRIKTLSQAQGFGVLVVAFPVPVKFQEDFPRSSYPPQLEKSARAEGLHYLDLEPIYRAAYQGHESLFIPYDGDHPNAAGHELAARAITDFLLSQSADLRHAGD